MTATLLAPMTTYNFIQFDPKLETELIEFLISCESRMPKCMQ